MSVSSVVTNPVAALRREITVRGLILGTLLCFVFTAANVYLGLRVGLTFASSIPAAVISMAALRALKGTTIVENNIVQTVASAAGALSAVIFVLPGLVMVGWWTGFPFWTSFGICAAGGILGVMYTIPLRRALVTQSKLPYPEGVAAAEVLKVGAGSRETSGPAAAEGKAGLLVISVATLASAGLAAVAGMRLVAAETALWFRPTASTATGIGAATSLALMGAGHLMGIAVGIAMLVGLFIAWGVATPILTALAPASAALPVAEAAQTIWTTQVRLIGAGAIGVAAIWALAKLVKPVIGGLASAMRAQAQVRAGRGGELPRTEQDIPITLVAIGSLLCLIPVGFLSAGFLQGSVLQAQTVLLVIFAVLYVAIAGFMVAAVCGYMAGLIGSSNSPVSGVAILAVLGAALILSLFAVGAVGREPLVAFALFVTSILIAVAVVANDNLQDLKTGQLVDATPWKQQAALILGVVSGAIVIAPVLDLMNRAYGFAGAPNAQAISDTPLPAPQATLISTLARGVIGGDLDWGLLAIGGLVGVGLVIVDEVLRRGGRYSLPPLGVGIAIYLPSTLTVPIVIGAALGWLYDRRADRRANGAVAKRLGVLAASGMIVGESLFSVALAGLIVSTGSATPLAVVPESFELTAAWFGLPALLLAAALLYLWTEAKARRTPAAPDAPAS